MVERDMELTMPVSATPPPDRASAPALALAACGPVAVGALLAVRSGTYAPLVAAPAVVFGVLAATTPALYIASAATGTAPSLAEMSRALVVALGAFGIALAGLLLPAMFLGLSAVSPTTTFAVVSAPIATAALLAMVRLSQELRARSVRRTTAGSLVFTVWWLATFGIAGRLWWDLANEVLS
jgi:hypothetical protein